MNKPQLKDIYTVEDIELLLRSLAAVSATNIVFVRREDGLKLILGIRKNPAESIPEPGDYCLIGGSNEGPGSLPGLPSLADIADNHLMVMLGITLTDDQAAELGGFVPTEYPMDESPEPFNSPFGPFGPLPIRRISFEREVLLTPKQADAIVPGGEIKAVQEISREQFDMLAETGMVSFPYQLENIIFLFDELIEEFKDFKNLQ